MISIISNLRPKARRSYDFHNISLCSIHENDINQDIEKEPVWQTTFSGNLGSTKKQNSWDNTDGVF
jgi:hypothetical protein